MHARTQLHIPHLNLCHPSKPSPALSSSCTCGKITQQLTAPARATTHVPLRAATATHRCCRACHESPNSSNVEPVKKEMHRMRAEPIHDATNYPSNRVQRGLLRVRKYTNTAMPALTAATSHPFDAGRAQLIPRLATPQICAAAATVTRAHDC
jgi:hypothetical protein